jgi:hypothetical protein
MWLETLTHWCSNQHSDSSNMKFPETWEHSFGRKNSEIAHPRGRGIPRPAQKSKFWDDFLTWTSWNWRLELSCFLGWMPCFAIWDGVAGVARFVRSWIPKFLVVSHCCLSTSETVQILNATLYTRIKRKIWIAAPHSLFLWHYFSNKKKQH